MTNKEFSMNDAPISFDSTHATAWAFGADHGWQACAEQYEAKLKVAKNSLEAVLKVTHYLSPAYLIASNTLKQIRG
jgi:hypothetical protein